MEEEARFRWSILAGLAFSGSLFWASFTHWRIVEGIAAGLVMVALYWFRFSRPQEAKLLRGIGTRREVRRFRITFAVLTLIVIGLCIAVLELTAKRG